MSKNLEFSSKEKIQKIALKNEKFRNFLKEINDEDINFEDLEAVNNTYKDFDIFVHDGELKFDSDLYMIQEGGFYFINGDLTVNGFIQCYGATVFCVNGSITASQILFSEDTYIEKDVIVNEAYFVDTDLNLTVNGELKADFIYSSINTGKININLLDSNTKGVIVRDSYDEMGYPEILENLGLKEVTEDEDYEWHLTV